jgi:sodium transport system permease protein
VLDRTVWIIFRKEMVDIFRDSKTWIAAFLIPVIVIPFVVFLLTNSMKEVEEDAKAYIPIAIKGESMNPLTDQLLDVPGVKMISSKDPIKALREGKVRAVVEVPRDFSERIAAGNTVRVNVFYDSSNRKSDYAREVIERAAAVVESEVVAQRLHAAGLSQTTVYPLATTYTNVASEEKRAGGALASIVPLMLILALASGGIPTANDLVAGEKERGTLETMITAPIPSGSILAAKLLAVMAMSMISALASAISMIIIFRMMPMTEAPLTLGFLQPSSLVMLLVTILLLSAWFAALELLLSTIARSFKEAQVYMTPVVFLAMAPSYMLMPLAPVDVPLYYYGLPFFNGAAIFKEIFYGDLSVIHAVLTVLSSVIYVIIVIALAARFFRKERMLVK